MGNSRSKKGTRSEDITPLIAKTPKRNKDHKRDKAFRIGLSFGRGDLFAEGHLQMGYVSKTKKVYSVVGEGVGVPEASPPEQGPANNENP